MDYDNGLGSLVDGVGLNVQALLKSKVDGFASGAGRVY